MQNSFDAFCHQRDEDRRRQAEEQARTGQLPEQEVFGLLDALTNEEFGRLQALRQAGQFQHHHHMVLNFIDAVERLHALGMDGGFLQRVASANDENQRRNLMQGAYQIGWGGSENISQQLVINLLQRNRLVEVIDLMGIDDSDSNGEW